MIDQDWSCGIRSKSYTKFYAVKKQISLDNTKYLNTCVSPSLTKYNNTPHFLMELSLQEHSILKECCIHVDGLTLIKSTQGTQKTYMTNFHSAVYGTEVKKDMINDVHELNLDRMKRKMVLITMNKSECVKAVTDVHIINTCLQDTNQSFEPSGVVVLMMTMKECKRADKDIGRIQWARLIIQMCKHCKNNILASKMVSHHDSQGSIYAFGHQGVFKTVNNSTVGLYEVKKRFKDDRQLELEQMSTQIEDMISVEMCFAKNTLSNIVKQVGRLILPAVDVAHDMQNVYGNINLNKCDRKTGSMCSTNVCVNATTGEFHTEKDTSYTMITVPLQDYKSQRNGGNIYKFLFKLNDNVCISFPLTPNVSFMFSGTFLCHRQAGNTSKYKEVHQFVNLSSYGNQKLFNHIRKSFTRNIQDGLNII